MFARGTLPLNPACPEQSRRAPLSPSNQNSLSPIIPALAHVPANSNYSRTYATPGGGGVWSDQSHNPPIWSDHASSLSAGACQPSANSFPCVSYANIGGGGLVLPIPRSEPCSLSALRVGALCVSAVSPSFLARHSPLRLSPLPICRLRPHSPLRDTGTSASVATESVTRLRNDQAHR